MKWIDCELYMALRTAGSSNLQVKRMEGGVCSGLD